MGRGPSPSYYHDMNDDYVEGTLTCLRQSTIKAVINSDFPNVLNIEPTNFCNLTCVYCPRQRAAKGVGMMPYETFTQIIDEARDYQKLIMLNLHKDGESFLHPRFLDMVRYAKQADVAKTIHVNTNALCWTERIIDELLDSGLDDVTISLDAAWPSTYLRDKGKDLLAVAERNVRLFFEKRARIGRDRPFARVKIMEFNGVSSEEIAEFHSKWGDVADQVQVTGIHSWSGAVDGVTPTDETSAKRYPCVIMWYALVVNWNGETTVCSVDWDTEISLGNCNTLSLHEIWQGQNIKRARASQLFQNLAGYRVCSDCLVWVSIGDLSPWLLSQHQFYE